MTERRTDTSCPRPAAAGTAAPDGEKASAAIRSRLTRRETRNTYELNNGAVSFERICVCFGRCPSLLFVLVVPSCASASRAALAEFESGARRQLKKSLGQREDTRPTRTIHT